MDLLEFIKHGVCSNVHLKLEEITIENGFTFLQLKHERLRLESYAEETVSDIGLALVMAND